MIPFLVFMTGSGLLILAFTVLHSYRGVKMRIDIDRRVGAQPKKSDLSNLALRRNCTIALVIAGVSLLALGLKWNRIFPEPYQAIASSPEVSAQRVSVPSDPTGTYTLISKTGEQGLAVITTKRSGSSGVTWSKRAYNCSSQTVMYLGTGGSYAEMTASSPDPGMTPIVFGSIADYVGREACR